MSLESKIAAFMNSPAGQKRLKDTIAEYRGSGVKRTNAGSRIVTASDATMLAGKLADMIVAHASADGVPGSVLSEMGMTMSLPSGSDKSGKYTIDLSFSGNLHRDSLYNEMYDGIDNIVALFNNGYVARNYTYGYWDGHSYTGEYNTLRTMPGDNFAYVRSKIGRPTLNFMQSAINEFVNAYKEYGVSVELSDEYNGDNSFSII